MNESTLVSVHCYAGDENLVKQNLPCYEHHEAPVVILSPVDSPVTAVGPHICRQAGMRAYIGQTSLDRQVEHLRILLSYPFEFFLLNDADSFCVSPVLPRALYEYQNTLWSNQVHEPRPHASPYPKIAAQPPYFLTRQSLEAIVAIAPSIRAHEITPYLDWAMLAWACEAGLANRAFSELEQSSSVPFNNVNPWKVLRYRIEKQGAVMMHPIKLRWQMLMCRNARQVYEKRAR